MEQFFFEVKFYFVRGRERECVFNDVCKIEIKVGKMLVLECVNVFFQLIRQKINNM